METVRERYNQQFALGGGWSVLKSTETTIANMGKHGKGLCRNNI